jgi:hypothetical protein
LRKFYEKVSKSHPEFLHPNLKEIALRPWGAKEFALRDEQVCIKFNSGKIILPFYDFA